MSLLPAPARSFQPSRVAAKAWPCSTAALRRTAVERAEWVSCLAMPSPFNQRDTPARLRSRCTASNTSCSEHAGGARQRQWPLVAQCSHACAPFSDTGRAHCRTTRCQHIANGRIAAARHPHIRPYTAWTGHAASQRQPSRTTWPWEKHFHASVHVGLRPHERRIALRAMQEWHQAHPTRQWLVARHVVSHTCLRTGFTSLHVYSVPHMAPRRQQQTHSHLPPQPPPHECPHHD